MAVGATIKSAGMSDPMGGALPLPLAVIVDANDDARPPLKGIRRY